MNRITLLLADDHDLFREGVAGLLSSQENLHVIAQEKTGVDALATIREMNPTVALLDISMPDMTGLDVCRAIQEEKLTTQSIILTMHDDRLLMQEAMQRGAQGYLLKDNTFDEVIEAIHTVAQGGQFVSPSLAEQVEDTEKLAPLSSREKEVLRMIAEGETVKVIANKLDVSTKSIDTYRQRLMRKLGAKNSAQLIQYAVKRSLV